MSSALEHLAAGSQGVLTKRIDLALLDGHELLSRSLQSAVWVGAGALLVVAAWLSAAASFVQFVAADSGTVARLALFALVNGASALGFIAFAMRHERTRHETP